MCLKLRPPKSLKAPQAVQEPNQHIAYGPFHTTRLAQMRPLTLDSRTLLMVGQEHLAAQATAG